jgi:magnesium-transporting ATPase (P-type)
VVLITNGMEVPADGILIDAADITADESAMTGYLFSF